MICPAYGSAFSDANSPRGVYWLVHVPIDGAPELTNFPHQLDMSRSLAQMIDDREGGWAFMFEGARIRFTRVKVEDVNLSNGQSVTVQEEAFTEDDGRLPHDDSSREE